MPHVPHKNHWLPDEFPLVSNKTRTKRSFGVDDEDEDPARSVETLVVADRDMVLKHGTDNVTTYILTVFNMVSQWPTIENIFQFSSTTRELRNDCALIFCRFKVSMLYQDSAIGNNVSVVLVGLVLLEGDEVCSERFLMERLFTHSANAAVNSYWFMKCLFSSARSESVSQCGTVPEQLLPVAIDYPHQSWYSPRPRCTRHW